MSPLDQSKEVPNLKEDGEGSVQVKMDTDMKIDGAKVIISELLICLNTQSKHISEVQLKWQIKFHENFDL